MAPELCPGSPEKLGFLMPIYKSDSNQQETFKYGDDII
jgi:hypothetical protein